MILKLLIYLGEGLLWITLSVIIFQIIRIVYKKLTTPLRKMKSAGNNIPIFGNIIQGLLSTPEEMFENIRKHCRENRPIFKLSFLHLDAVEIVNPGDAEQILNSYKHMKKSMVYNFLRQWLGDGLLTTTGEKWHTRRKLLAPAFHLQIMNDFITSFNEETTELISKIEQTLEDSEIVTLKPLINWFTLQSLGDTAMGFETIDEGVLIDYRKKVNKMGDFFVDRLYRPWLHNDTVYSLTQKCFNERVVVQGLHRFSETVIRRRKMMHNDIAEGRDIFYKKKMALLDLLIKEQQKGNIQLSDQDIREEVDTFMFEGHDTTSSAIEMMLVLLANHQDVQDRLRDEIDRVMGDQERPVAFEDLGNFKYMEMCLKECLRLYPPVPSISRFAGEEFTTTTGYRIPKGTPLHIHIWDLHRDPDLYPDPEKFDPERFTPERCAARAPYAYVPFSAGPRNCIGQKFAMYEIKIVLCGLLKHFRLEPVTKVQDVKFMMHFTSKTSTKIQVKFIRR